VFNRAEGERHRFARDIFETHGSRIIVPWPVFTEVDLFLRSRGNPASALEFGRSLRRGDLTLASPSDAELAGALDLLERYRDLGIDLPDAAVMAMSDARRAWILTWDFRHFRAVVFRRGQTLPLLVHENELPTH
jgi:predicted nucleic acid-binding protein